MVKRSPFGNRAGTQHSTAATHCNRAMCETLITVLCAEMSGSHTGYLHAVSPEIRFCQEMKLPGVTG